MKKINFLASATAILMLFSCNDYLDVNQNTNKPLYKDLVPSELLSAAQLSCHRNMVTIFNEYGNVQTNAWAGNVSQFGNVYPNQYALTLNNTFQTALWDSQYTNIGNFALIAKTPNADHSNDNYVAAALICKVHYAQYITDLYGDIPYSTAFLQQNGSLTPAYNDDQRVYRLMIADLESAKALINAANPNAADISGSDSMLHGVMADWYAFANTIELRMLLRMSGNTGAVATWRDAKLVQLQADIAGGPAAFITDDVRIQPGYNAANDNKMNPYYAYVGLNAGATAATQNWTYLATSGHAYKCFTTYASYASAVNNSTAVTPTLNYPNVADPRRTRIARGTFRGVTQGSQTIDVYAGTVTGQPSKGGQGNGLLNPYLEVAVAVFDDYALVDGFVMTKAESYFLQAEAGLRGYTGFTAGGAVADYNSGIDASMEYLGVTGLAPATATTYKTQIENKLGFSMTATGASPAQKLQGLMYQKWVALMGINGIESYIDYTRTGFPVTPLPLTATNYTNRAKRLMYPNSELVANSANVPSVSEAECFSVNSKSPFWLQGDPALGN
jgi:Starch-binding associating with outer membrane